MNVTEDLRLEPV